MHKRTVSLLALAWVLGALSSTADAARRDDDDEPRRRFPLEHGIYVVAVQINTVIDTESASAWRRMFVTTNDDKRKDFYTDIVLGEHDGTVIWIGHAPPGKYTVNQLYTWSGEYRRWAPIGEAAGVFELQAGRVTVVGSVLTQPLGRRYQLTRLPIDPSIWAYVREVSGEDLAGHRSDEPLITAEWPSNADGLLSLAQRNAPFTRSIVPFSDGTLLAPAKLGQVLRLEDDGLWLPRATGARVDLLTLAEARGGGVLVGGEFGLVRRARSLHAEWQDLQLPAGEGSVHAVAEAANGDLYAVSYHGTSPFRSSLWEFFFTGGFQRAQLPSPVALRLWRRAPDAAAWDLARELPIEKGHAPLVFGRGNVIYTSTKSETIERFDVDTGEWSSSSLPVEWIQAMPDGTLTGMETSGWRKPFISRDGGRTWTHVNIRRKDYELRLDVPLAALSSGELVARGKIKRKAGKKGEATLFISADQGASWREIPEAATACSNVREIVVAGDRLWLICNSEQVFGWNRESGEFKAQREFVSP